MLLPATVGFFVGLFSWALPLPVVSGSASDAPITSRLRSAGTLMPGSHGFHLISVLSQSQESCWGSLLDHAGVPPPRRDQGAYPGSTMCAMCEQQHTLVASTAWLILEFLSSSLPHPISQGYAGHSAVPPLHPQGCVQHTVPSSSACPCGDPAAPRRHHRCKPRSWCSRCH